MMRRLLGWRRGGRSRGLWFGLGPGALLQARGAGEGEDRPGHGETRMREGRPRAARPISSCILVYRRIPCIAVYPRVSSRNLQNGGETYPNRWVTATRICFIFSLGLRTNGPEGSQCRSVRGS